MLPDFDDSLESFQTTLQKLQETKTGETHAELAKDLANLARELVDNVSREQIKGAKLVDAMIAVTEGLALVRQNYGKDGSKVLELSFNHLKDDILEQLGVEPKAKHARG